MEEQEAEYLLKQAERCRRLAATEIDEQMRSMLLDMERDYEAGAARIRLGRN